MKFVNISATLTTLWGVLVDRTSGGVLGDEFESNMGQKITASIGILD